MRSMRDDIARMALAATELEMVQNKLFLNPQLPLQMYFVDPIATLSDGSASFLGVGHT